MAEEVKKRDWCPIHDSIEPCQRCAEAEAITRCSCGGAEVIDRLTAQLHTAIRLGMEGQKTSLKLLLNQQARRYPALRELAAKYMEPSDILRADAAIVTRMTKDKATAERKGSLLQKCKLQRDMLTFLEKSVADDEVIQAATVVKTITETAGDIAYEAGRYNEALIMKD